MFITHRFLPQLYQVMVVLSNIMLFRSTSILLAVTNMFAPFSCVNVSFQNSNELVPSNFIFGTF